MNNFKYERTDPIDRGRAIRDFESSDPQVVADALYAVCRSEEDPKWLEEECLKRLKSPELAIRWAAATCLGDLALFRRPLDTKRVIPAMVEATQDPTICDPANFSLSLIRQFSSSEQ